MFRKKRWWHSFFSKLFRSSFGLNPNLLYYLYGQDILDLTFEQEHIILQLNGQGLERLKRELNIHSKSAVSIICVRDNKEMLLLTKAPDISYILFGNSLKWRPSERNDYDVQKEFLSTL